MKNLADEITTTIPYNKLSIVKRPNLLVQSKIKRITSPKPTESPADNSRLVNNDVPVGVEYSQRPQARNTTKMSLLQTSTIVSERPPPISEPDVQKKHSENGI